MKSCISTEECDEMQFGIKYLAGIVVLVLEEISGLRQGVDEILKLLWSTNHKIQDKKGERS
jgi:hypothetical protein